MQRSNRASRTAKKTRVQSTRSTATTSRVGRTSSLSTLSTVAGTSHGRSFGNATTTAATVRRTATANSSRRPSSSVQSRKTFSTLSSSDNEAPMSAVASREPQRRPFEKRTRPPFFKAEHADNNAVNSVPKFGRAQLSKPFPPLRQKMVNPDLTVGDFTHHDIAKGWHVLVSYPKDFTFVCPSELNELADRIGEFNAINTKVWGVSCDSENVHHAWMSTPRKKGGIEGLTFPLIADVNRVVTASIGALLPENFGTRATLIYGNGKLRHASFNEPPVGRSVDEILRLVTAFQYFDEHGEVCPARWKKPGDPTMVPTKEGSREYFEQEQ